MCKMKYFKIFIISVLLAVVCNAADAQKKYNYQTVDGDPLKARIYTLDNGLKVYLTVNKVEPRIQTYIAVRVGGKNDPHETTGLAHYLEHLMFKGTTSYGTTDYKREKPLLDSIEARYEVYRHTRDEAKRKAIYHKIDSLSYLASTIAVANEYDKLMAQIGSVGSNAYTSEDVTCYIEDIPSNEVDNWAKIQSDRFKDLVIRGFHTELEAVYEEYNIYLTRDFDKIFEQTNKILFPNHPYGMQTVIGTQDHLKNPSITNIKNHFKYWYVPNNVAICMSGDFDFDEVMATIDKYFGDWKPNPQLKYLDIPAVKPLTAPVYKDVYGREADMVTVSWPFPGSSSKEADYLNLIEKLLTNGTAGLFDLNLNQQQKVLQAEAYNNSMSDYSVLYTIAVPKEGQTLEQARDLLVAEVKKIAEGDFSEELLKAVINNLRLSKMKALEKNSSRASMFVSAFVDGVDWKYRVEEIDRLSKITKADLVAFAKRTLTDGYACIYKHKGDDPNEKKIEKPAISPIEMNRNKCSDFVKNVAETKVEKIEPKFIDFKKDLSVSDFKNGNKLFYKQNSDNSRFKLSYIVEHGSKNDRELSVASDLMNYAGTSKLSAEQIQRKLYELACEISVSVSPKRTTVVISGLSENMKPAMELCEKWLAEANVSKDVYADFVANTIESRRVSKLDQRSNFSHLQTWGMFGDKNSMTNILSQKELESADPKTLLAQLGKLKDYKQTILYYGPLSMTEVAKMVDKLHKTAKQTRPAEVDNDFVKREVAKTEVFIAPYEAKNIYMQMYSNDGQKYNTGIVPDIELFNNYFGQDMSCVVFQELREARGLAYSASARYVNGAGKDKTNSFYTYIITQNDKMKDCVSVFKDIIENMPKSETSFAMAKEALLKRLATVRTSREWVLNSYFNALDMGHDHDIDADVYNKVKDMTLDDLVDFQKKNVRGRTYRYLILGDSKELDMDFLKSLGEVHEVSTETIFGY